MVEQSQVAEQRAYALLNRHWPRGNIPVEPCEIAASLGMSMRLAALPATLSARYRSGSGLVLNEGSSKRRRRFACAHALWFWLMGHHADRDDEVGAYSSNHPKFERREANIFALALLMPADYITALIEQRNMTSPDALSQVLGVSTVALSYRLSQMGLLPTASPGLSPA